MKKVNVLILCLVLFTSGILMSNPAKDTKTVSLKTQSGYYIPVICDGVQIDYLSGIIDAHIRTHYEAGVAVWRIYNFDGEIANATGEVFDVKEIYKVNLPQSGDQNFKTHLKGDQGSHYKLAGRIVDGILIMDKANCH